jgi:hypothetical protein
MYYTLNQYLKETFGEKVWKIPVNAGFTCPNRSGEKATGGCIYCDCSSFTHTENGNIKNQVLKRIEKLRKKNINKFIVYFQSGTNTYGNFSVIKEKIYSSLVDSDIVGLHIGTRPDCINNELINFFVKLDKNYQITVELGLQSSNDKTLKFINRGHSSEDFTKACEKLRKAGLKICAHIILGLPGETEEDMLRTISFLNSNKVDSVKFHHLHIIKNTPLAKLYENKKIQILKEDEYIKILAESIARLPKKTIIARLVGDAPQNMLVAPDWPDSKIAFLNKLDTYMINNNLFQGKFNKT